MPVETQQLEPRAYVAAPIGANFIVVGITGSSGDVLVDPSVPLQDVHADAAVATVGYGRTFSLFTRHAIVYAALPWAYVDASGKVGGDLARVSRAGLADPTVRLSVHLVGNPAMPARALVKTPGRTIVGTGIRVTPPIGDYDPAKLINLGTNRWAFKPEAAVSIPVHRWLLDIYGGVWLFTTNSHYYPGTDTLAQSPIGTIEAHVSYNLTLRAWAAVDMTWYAGGRPSLNGVPKASLQNNTRMGGTISLPAGQRHSVKLAYSWNRTTSAGRGYQLASVGWQTTWLSPARVRDVSRASRRRAVLEDPRCDHPPAAASRVRAHAAGDE